MKEITKNYNAQDFEQNIYKQWEASGMFNPDNLNAKKKYFSIALPPPNATGVLHLGHAAMLAYQDTMVRYHRMLGENTLWVPGTDHAAIATQNVVEKKIAKEQGKTKEDLGREEFLNEVRSFVAGTQENIRDQIKRMGSSLDWSRERYTFSDSLSQAVNMAFKKMYDDDLIYRGHRIVNWCPRCHSTLSDDEVEYKKEKTKLYWIKYGPFVLATTRLETKLGDIAVAVHPEDNRYKDMVGKDYMIPGVLGEFQIKVIADKSIDREFGSGAVKVTPAHSFVDNEMAAKNDIAMRQIINEDGCMMDNCGKYAGMTTIEARKAILKDMGKMGLIDHIDEDYEHNLSVCYRCDTPIEPLPSEQWFVNVDKKISGKNKSLKELSVEAVESGQIDILPDKFKKVYFHWMNNLHDWCISRQIWWGHRIPVWYRDDSNININNIDLDLTFFRHTQSEANKLKIPAGHKDYKLTELGKSQAGDIAKRINQNDYDVIFSSDLSRAKDTASILFPGTDIICDDRLREIDFGDVTSQGGGVVDKFRLSGYPNGETYQEVYSRVVNFLQSIGPEYKGKRIAIVAHNGIWKVLEIMFNNKDFTQDTLTSNAPIGAAKYGIINSSKFQKINSGKETYVGINPPDGDGWKQDEDTLDTWFSSALWTFSTLLDQDYQKYSSFEEWVKNSPDLKKFHPTSVMETGYDILFFWVARMILMTTYLLDEVPFKKVYLHGLIRDKQGRKMSKSLGNGIDPIEMIDKFGADALRLSMTVGSTPGNDMRLYEEKIEGYRNFVNKLWNISRYIFGSVQEVKIVNKKPKPQSLADAWILSELDKLIISTTSDLDELKFSPAIERLYEFTWSKFADWYIEISKIETGKDEILLYILEQLLKLWHPFAPFVTEAIWENFDNGLLAANQWPKQTSGFAKLFQKKNNSEFDVIKDLIVAIRNAKGENKITPTSIINCQIKGEESLVRANTAIISKLAKVNLVVDKDASWFELHIKGVDIALDIDRKEAVKVQVKQKDELNKYIGLLQKKLSDDKFIKNAPADVVAKEQAKLVEAKEKLNKLQ
jgi:valyl-tRNA synthetase